MPGGVSLHNTMLPHGPDVEAFEAASNVELKPRKLEGTLAFMFETRFPQRVTRLCRGDPAASRSRLRPLRPAVEEAFRPGQAVAMEHSMSGLDATHDPALRSWVETANGHADFPIQNLPFGIFSPAGDPRPRAGVAIGDQILDLPAAQQAGLFAGEAARVVALSSAATLNGVMAVGPAARIALRTRLSELLREGAADQAEVAPLLHPAEGCTMHLPARIGDYTDFYAGIHHAMNVGRQFRPDNPLLPNYKHVPIGYHGRASSVVVSGTPVRRPTGQTKAPDADAPAFAPCRRLDFELELGIWIGPGNAARRGHSHWRGGQPHRRLLPAQRLVGARHPGLGIPAARAVPGQELRHHHLPLGGDAGGAGAIPPAAAAAAGGRSRRRCPTCSTRTTRRAARSTSSSRCYLHTPSARRDGLPPHRLSLSHARHLYWTAAQLVAHHSSNGCNLRPGDLLGSGTISAPDARRPRQPARDHRGRPPGRRAPGRRDADVPRGRRRADHPGPGRARRLRARRVRRGARHHPAGGRHLAASAAHGGAPLRRRQP